MYILVTRGLCSFASSYSSDSTSAASTHNATAVQTFEFQNSDLNRSGILLSGISERFSVCASVSSPSSNSFFFLINDHQSVSEVNETTENMQPRTTTLVIMVVVLAVAQGKIGFVKDQSMDATFPPPVFKPDPSIPEGHLRPLGKGTVIG